MTDAATEQESRVRSHYGRGDVLRRIEERLRARGIDPSRPSCRDLNEFDQLHAYGILATEAHAEIAGVAPGMRVLDVGCGLGGASRWLAEHGCRVIGIDLTPEYVAVAQLLTERCALAEGIAFHEASVLALPFEDGRFDHVWCHNVTMNIAAKEGMAREVARVLRPGGRFSCVETERGPGAPPRFPLPWADNAADSFLATPEKMRIVLERAGLRITRQMNFQPELAKRGQPPAQANAVTMGDDFAVRFANVGAGFREQSLIDQFLLAEKA